jgi:hypothetical protein
MRPTLLLGLFAVSFLLALGCKSTAEAKPDQAAPPAAFKPTGEVIFSSSGISGGSTFDATRVVGPRVNMSQRGDGSWAGTLQDGSVDASLYPNRLAGVDLTLTQEKKPDGVIITGQYQGRILRFEVDSQKFVARTPNRSFTLTKNGEGTYGSGALKLTGDAALPNPPWPQFALALVGAF